MARHPPSWAAKNQQADGIAGKELDPLRRLTLDGPQAQIDRKRQIVLYL